MAYSSTAEQICKILCDSSSSRAEKRAEQQQLAAEIDIDIGYFADIYDSRASWDSRQDLSIPYHIICGIGGSPAIGWT